MELKRAWCKGAMNSVYHKQLTTQRHDQGHSCLWLLVIQLRSRASAQRRTRRTSFCAEFLITACPEVEPTSKGTPGCFEPSVVRQARSGIFHPGPDVVASRGQTGKCRMSSSSGTFPRTSSALQTLGDCVIFWRTSAVLLSSELLSVVVPLS